MPSADAYPQTIFDAEVSYIAPAIDPQRGSIEVRLRVPKPLGDFLILADLYASGGEAVPATDGGPRR